LTNLKRSVITKIDCAFLSGLICRKGGEEKKKGESQRRKKSIRLKKYPQVKRWIT